MITVEMLIPLVIVAAGIAMACRSGTHEVFRHMTLRERLTYFKLPVAVGMSIPLLGVGVSSIIHLAMPELSALACLTISGIVLLPVLLGVVVLCKEPVRRYQRRMVLQTEWAKTNKLTEEKLQASQ